MKTHGYRYLVPCAGLLALAAPGCATQKASESPNPTTREVASSQQQSEEALKQAQEAQKNASDAAQKAAAAQAQVREDQRKLAADEQAARAQQARAQQLQRQAHQQTGQAAERAQREQESAFGALSQQTQEIGRGQQSAAGVVTDVRPDEVAVQPPSGQPMRFKVDDRTRVQIDGQQGSADQIREGTEARVSYEPSASGPRAVTIRVDRSGAPGSSPGSSYQPQGSGSPGQPAPRGSPGQTTSPQGR